MTESIARQVLPKISSKRAQTEGTEPKHRYQRFSFHIQSQHESQYLKQYDSRRKEQRKMVRLYAVNQLPKQSQTISSLKQTLQKVKQHCSKRSGSHSRVQSSAQKNILISGIQQTQLLEQSQVDSYGEKSREGKEEQQREDGGGNGREERKEQVSSLQGEKGGEEGKGEKRVGGVMQRFTFNNVILSEIENFYLQHMKSKSYRHEALLCFIKLLQHNNNIFKKINPIVTESLLKLGFITRYSAGQTIYREHSPICNVGIIIWGQAILKKRSTKFKFNCYPGQALGEEILFEELRYSERRSASVEKGRFFTFEKCKAAGSCGVLWVGEREWGWVCEELTKQGFKDIMVRFQSLLYRAYIKKRDHRLLLG